MPRTLRFALLALAVLVLLVALAASFGWYPVALVNGHAVTARAMDENSHAANYYYQRLLDAAAAGGPAVASTTPVAFAADTLDLLVENELVREGAEREVGNDIKAAVADKVGRYRNDPKLEEAVRALYGLSADDFQRLVLEPQAERDILSGKLFISGTKLSDWLTEERKAAHVSVFAAGFRWDGEHVVPW